MHIISVSDFPLFCFKTPYSAGRMLASKTASSARNFAGRIYPSLAMSLPFSHQRLGGGGVIRVGFTMAGLSRKSCDRERLKVVIEKGGFTVMLYLVIYSRRSCCFAENGKAMYQSHNARADHCTAHFVMFSARCRRGVLLKL